MWQSWLFQRNAFTAAADAAAATAAAVTVDAAADATTDNAIEASNAVSSKEYVIWIT